MNRNEFIEILTKRLKENNIGDIEEIVAEYEEHFTYKLADGYSEQEIAAKLGNPDTLAMQFISESTAKKPGGTRALTQAMLVLLGIFVLPVFAMLFASAFVMAVFSFACVAVGICLFGGLSPYTLIPAIPYWCGAVFAVSMVALAALSMVACIYYFCFIRQCFRSYTRFCNNLLAASVGRAQLPSLSIYPKFSAKVNRRLGKTAIISLAAFAASMVSGYIACAISAQAIEFWHAWGWFGWPVQ